VARDEPVDRRALQTAVDEQAQQVQFADARPPEFHLRERGRVPAEPIGQQRPVQAGQIPQPPQLVAQFLTGRRGVRARHAVTLGRLISLFAL
jgi:hypothetical protein